MTNGSRWIEMKLPDRVLLRELRSLEEKCLRVGHGVMGKTQFVSPDLFWGLPFSQRDKGEFDQACTISQIHSSLTDKWTPDFRYASSGETGKLKHTSPAKAQPRAGVWRPWKPGSLCLSQSCQTGKRSRIFPDGNSGKLRSGV